MSEPLYDIHESWATNLQKGPYFKGKLPERSMPKKSEWFNFLGHKVASRIGVFAGPLLDSKWIQLASNLGFDLMTYKTIRSKASEGHPLPNILFIDQNNPFEPTLLPRQVMASLKEPPQKELTITNSFGMPSKDNRYLSQDIALAKTKIKEGQVMIVSVTGSSDDKKALIDDFIQTALLAKNAGAEVIEANFSCPNVVSKEGSLYLSPETSYEVAAAIVQAIDPLPLIVKVGLFSDPNAMTKTFLALSCAGVKAIAGINTISLNVVDQKGNPALGPNRLRSGVCGSAIRKAALKFTKDSRSIIDTEKLPLTLIGGGGIVEPEHFDEFLNLGADFAFTATGMMWDPLLAHRYHELKTEAPYAYA